jgi:Flp pilus assembly protein TadG
MPRPKTRLMRDERGATIAEFALVLPILITILLSTVEITNLLLIDRKVVAATQTAADLITQETTLDDARLNDIFTATELILEPFPATSLQIGVASVRYQTSNGAAYLDWSESHNTGTVPDPTVLAATMGEPGASVIIARVNYTYDPIFVDLVIGSLDLEETAFSRPRRSGYVARL